MQTNLRNINSNAKAEESLKLYRINIEVRLVANNLSIDFFKSLKEKEINKST